MLTRKQKLKANIWKFYLYRVFSSLLFMSPIFVLFLQDNNLSMTQIMILQSAYTAAIMLAVVPSGILADYIGRKKVMIVNAFFFSAGWIVYATGHSFYHFMIAEITIAMSSAMWMAAGTPFFYDTLKELGEENSFKKRYGKVIWINNICWGIGALAGGLIAVYSLRLPFLLSAIPTAIAFIITFSFTDTKDYRHGEKKYLAHLKDAVVFSAKHPKVRFFIIYSAIMFAMIFTVAIFCQPYLQSIKIPIIFFGAVYAVANIATAVGGKYAHRFEKMLGEKKILVILLAALALSFIGMGSLVFSIGVIFVVLISFVLGVLDPVITDYFQKHVESHHRATVSSLSTLVMEGVSAAFAPFFGWIFDVYSLQAALMLMGIILIIDMIILAAVYSIGRK